jgi:hypothetical protein
MANILTSSSDGPQSKYTFILNVIMNIYYCTIQNAREKVSRKSESNNGNT